MARYFLGLMLGFLALAAFAADECDVEREIQTAVARKMSKAQQEQIRDEANELCSRKQMYVTHMDAWRNDQKYIHEMSNLIASFCGTDPESIGRGGRCRQDKAKLEAFVSSKEDDVKTLLADEKRIKKLELQFEKTKNAKPLPVRKVDPVLLAKQKASAAIAKVKQDILESLKDPDSAKFRRIVVSADGSFVCGEVNAKNAMGGYVGYKKFANIEDKDQDFSYYEDRGKLNLQADCEKLTQK